MGLIAFFRRRSLSAPATWLWDIDGRPMYSSADYSSVEHSAVDMDVLAPASLTESDVDEDRESEAAPDLFAELVHEPISAAAFEARTEPSYETKYEAEYDADSGSGYVPPAGPAYDPAAEPSYEPAEELDPLSDPMFASRSEVQISPDPLEMQTNFAVLPPREEGPEDHSEPEEDPLHGATAVLGFGDGSKLELPDEHPLAQALAGVLDLLSSDEPQADSPPADEKMEGNG